MAIPSEIERLEQLVSGERPPPFWLQLSGECCDDPTQVLNRVRDVMRVVVSRRTEEWPSDDWWEKNLPAWFVEPAKTCTYDMIKKDRTLWHFGSWVDAIRDTGWEWWSSAIGHTHLEVNLCAYEHPYRVEVFMYVLKAAGMKSIVFREAEVG